MIDREQVREAVEQWAAWSETWPPAVVNVLATAAQAWLDLEDGEIVLTEEWTIHEEIVAEVDL